MRSDVYLESRNPKTSPAAIATPHAAATEAGSEILAAGGSAVDAAITAAAVLCVVYPHNVALGSDAVALVRSPDSDIECVNATGWAGSGTDLEELRRRHGARLPARGIDTITVPGALAGWMHLHSRHGRLPVSDLLDAATRLARGGAPVSRSLASATEESLEDLRADPVSSSLFLRGGEPLEQGSVLVQAALGETLDALARIGLDAFYRGDIAAVWIDALAARGGAIRPSDASEYIPETANPLTGSLGDLTVATSPPNTQGFSLLRTLRTIAPHMSGSVPPRALLDAFLTANAARDEWLADPREGHVDIEALLDPAHVPARIARDARASGDTVGISVVDADGTAVSLIQSVYWGFGSCVSDSTTGILFQNRGTSFDLDEDAPGHYCPRARPRHTLMPVIATDAHTGDLRVVSSAMGGQGQPQIHAQVLLRLLAGLDARAATAAPRFVVGAFGAARPRQVFVEADAGSAVLDALRTLPDVEVDELDGRSEWLGHANIITRASDGSLDAASDPRSDGAGVVHGG